MRKKILFQILLGIEFLHCRKDPIMHRDLKPENALISINGTVKLSDFGLATELHPLNSTNKAITKVGTISYMAPEIG